MRSLIALSFMIFSQVFAGQSCELQGECEEPKRLRIRKAVRLISPAEKRPAGSFREFPLAEAAEAPLSERITDILQRQSGVQVNRTGAPGTTSLLGVRGASPEQMEYFIEGIPLPRPYSGPLNLETMPLPLFRSVEIYPSFVPAHLAATNIGGALDFRLRDAADTTYLGQALFSGIGASAVTLARSSPRGLNYVLVEQSRNTYTYSDNNGTPENGADDRRLTRQNEDFSRFGYTGYGRLASGPWQLGVMADFALTDRGLPGTQGNLLMHVRRREERGVAAMRLQYKMTSLQEMQLFATVSADRMQIDDRERELIAAGSEKTLSPQLMGGAGYSIATADISLGLYARARYQDISRNSAFLAERREFQAAMSVAYDPGFLRLAGQAALMGFADKAAANAFYASSAQEYQGQGVSGNALGAIRPLALLTKNGHDLLEIYGQLGYSYRAPTLYERFGDNVFVTPSETLRSEKALTNSAGLRGAFACPLGFTCSLRSEFWITGGRDYILFTQNSARTMIAVNASAAQIYGVENEFMLSLPESLLLSLRYTWLDARDYGNIPYYQDKFLPLRPRHHAVLTLSYLYRSLRFTFSGEFRGAIYRDRYNSYQYYQASRFTADTGVDYIVQSYARHTFTLAVRNLTDNQSSDVIGYPLPGRYALFKWMVEF